MIKRVMVVVLLGFLGLVVGSSVTSLGGPSYSASGWMRLPAHSRESAADLVAMVRGQHPGVRVSAAGGRSIYVSANGSLTGSWNAVAATVQELIGHADGKVSYLGSGGHALIRTSLGNPVHYGAVGLLAGLGAGLGFLLPPRSRLSAR
jgi:ABC-type molybdate transport system substrate-binding protein